jgi:hypothetical protein
MPTFLQLASEQGGNRFGPFPGGLIVLGTDGRRCQLVMGPMAGILPVHGQISDHGNGTFTVQPADRKAVLFLVQQGQGQMWPLQAAVTARHGDVLVVGTEAGPRFTLQFESDARQVRAVQQPGGGGLLPASAQRNLARQGGFGGAMQHEVKRQAQSKLMAGPFRELYTMYYRFKSGSFFQPRYLITAVGGLVVLLGGSFASCFGLFTAWWYGS